MPSASSVPPTCAATASTAAKLGVREDGKQIEQPLLPWFEQLVAPLDGGAQRLLAQRRVARAAAQQFKPPAQPVEQRFGREEPQPRRRQLNRQRQTIQPATDLGRSPPRWRR